MTKRGCLATILVIAIVVIAWVAYILCRTVSVPSAEIPQNASLPLTTTSDSTRLFDGAWLRTHSDGISVCYIHGDPMQRGYQYAMLTSDMMYRQERLLVDRMQTLVPSSLQQQLCLAFIKVFNRNLDQYLTDELKREIYGLSLADTHELDDLFPPYERQLYMHAAHDIGHAMQDYMKVGCTSFISRKGGNAIFGRNFDFYCGDEFAKDKVVTVCAPTDGHTFVSIGWAGMMGVVSGMNDCGLTICINASRGHMPSSAAMPISLLVRHLLMHCTTLSDVERECKQSQTFVAENIVVYSAIDRRMAVIEKSVDHTDLYVPLSSDSTLLCTNHFRTSRYSTDQDYIAAISRTDSPYRLMRLDELTQSYDTITPSTAAAILRDYHGVHDVEIGIGNDMAINQMIAHHSVIFEPESRIFYVSTHPWQLGRFAAFSLDSLTCGPSHIWSADTLSISADPFLQSTEFAHFTAYEQLKRQLLEQDERGITATATELDSLISLNPHYYQAYDIAADLTTDDTAAIALYHRALQCSIKQEAADRILDKIKQRSH